MTQTAIQSGAAIQKPLGTGLGAATTAEEVLQGISLAGKVAIVTGGYSGLGKETVRVLRNAGAQVIVPTRDIKRAKETLAGIDAEIEPMDLLDPASISAFADRFLASGRPLHILINNAGIMATPLKRDARGYESQFATNHLGHFQLTTRLLPALLKSGGARVVSVSSWGHHFSPVVFEDPHFNHRQYDPWTGYGQSKTANILFAVELDRRYQDQNVRAFAIHPGVIVETGLAKHIPKEALASFNLFDKEGHPIIDPSRNVKSVGQGAATQIWCATSPTLNGLGGVYCENCDIAEIDPGTVVTRSSTPTLDKHVGVLPYAVDPVAAQRLWKLSEELLAPRA